MSEQDSESSPMRTTEASHRNPTTPKYSMDEVASADNSIIGKVKSRVSSIFPNSLSKWFSPSSTKNNNNDSPNGSINVGGVNRRRRRLDIEDDDDEDVEDEDADDGDEENELGEYDENLLGQDIEDNSDDESNNSEEANAAASTMASGFKIAARRDALRPCAAVRQPPSKRSRLNLEVTTPIISSIRDTSLMQRQPIVSSTPATGVSNFRTASTNLSAGTGAGRSTNRYSHLNLYGNQGRKETAFNFQSSSTATGFVTPHVLVGRNVSTGIDSFDLETEQANQANLQSDIISSRRSLNIPPATLSATEHYQGLNNLKRQALSNFKNEYLNTSSLPRRTSTTIFENEASDDYVEQQQRSTQQLQQETQLERDEDDEYDVQQSKSFNGRLTDNLTYKRRKVINGADDGRNITDETFAREAAANLRDSASESSDGGVGVVTDVGLTAGRVESAAGSSSQVKQKAGGLFNLSAANSSRNGSRTSSFGNGLNFYTHLEGRKSLFAGTQSAASGQQNLNNSTLSLTSLNRRQFNASIYGSTSALSDSRLLNTFSPFYKGKTTYGGASAYNKYTGAGANAAVRITPTLIRPTSSLSTLSSSNNSLAAAAVGGNVSAENSSALSSTAKRILDLINDFATPLSDAKKMASNLKASQHQNQPQFAKGRRFNDADLSTTRAVRLSQIRSPYMRPSVTLHATQRANLSKANTVLPPVRELQVPSMSQLLQMKKMQSTTERSRQIATENSHRITAQQPLAATSLSEYTLPVELHSDIQRQQQQHHSKHINKIKNKVTSSVRVTASKDATDDAPLSAVNLPNIAFPIMQSSPKFDISLPNTITTKSPTSSASGGGDAKSSFGKKQTVSSFAFKAIDAVDNITERRLTAAAAAGTSTHRPKTNFKYSAPLQLEGVSPRNVAPINGNYKFSSPMLIQKDDGNSQTVALKTPISQTQPTLQLKSGSVLDALKKPFAVLPTIQAQDNSLAAQFKKSTNEWECETCMIRNKQELNKCVACETPRKSSGAEIKASPTTITSINTTVSGFGNQFKKSSAEWECDTCMIRNKQDANKCVACETPRKNSSGSSDNKSSALVPSLISGPSFGDTFKPKACTWECPTCLINNKNESIECVACQTKKPGSVNSGALMPKIGVPSLTSSDAGFTSLAASQKASKWECEACMTRNDTSRLKCVCCEQAKPGTQTVSEDVPKFSFGSTAAAKFSFGFGGVTSTAPKEEELRKNENVEKKTETTTAPATGFVFGTAVSNIPKQKSGFTFGVKPVDTSSEGKDAEKDVTVISKPSTNETVLADIKFGTSMPSLVTSKISTSITTAITTTVGLISATDTVTTTTSTTKSTPTTAINAPSEIAKTAPTFTFGSSSNPLTSTLKPVQQPTTSGFSFGLSKPTEAPTGAVVNQPAKEVSTNSGFTFNAPKTAATTKSFTFGTPAAAATTVAAPTATIKPLFSFSSTTSPTSTSTPPAAQPALSTTAQNSGGFSFGNISAPSSTPAAIRPLFGAVIASTSTTTVSSSTATTSAAKNVFGSFGSPSTTSTAFGGAMPSTTSSTTSTTFNTSSTFGSSTATSSPQFGIFGNSGGETAAKSKRTTLFGASSSMETPSHTPFAFGSTAATNSIVTATTAQTTWTKNSFVFGSPASSATPTSVMSNETLKQTPHSFGGFGTSSTSASIVNSPAASSLIFGNMAAPPPTTGTFGNATGATPLFSSNSSVAASGATGGVNNNLFGSAVSSNSSGNVTSAFGITPFGGGGGGSTALAQTFGSGATAPGAGTVPASNTFGGFGSLSSAATSANTTDGASAAKKSDTTFTFGGTQGVSQSTTGGFNFSSSAAIAKPAFNFGASNAATTGSFNFTGSAETTKSSTTQPFQFGATPLAPVFNFSGGAAVETTPSAPFQFNAGAASPAASNIFAPAATVPGAQSAQQARRKIRAPTRRLTPR